MCLPNDVLKGFARRKDPWTGITSDENLASFRGNRKSGSRISDPDSLDFHLVKKGFLSTIHCASGRLNGIHSGAKLGDANAYESYL
jgi:hypothetical protein